MAKRPANKPTRPIQGRTDAPGFASRIRSPQQPAAAAAAAAMRALLPFAAIGKRPEMKRGRGGRGR
jgi:hypothetical protein